MPEDQYSECDDKTHSRAKKEIKKTLGQKIKADCEKYDECWLGHAS
jgi:hypothetical protein